MMHPETKKPVAPVELCPILKTLYKILIKRLESWKICGLSAAFFGGTFLLSCQAPKELFHFFFVCRELATDSILQAIRDESMYDPRERIEMAQRQSLYRPSLLGLPKGDAKA